MVGASTVRTRRSWTTVPPRTRSTITRCASCKRRSRTPWTQMASCRPGATAFGRSTYVRCEERMSKQSIAKALLGLILVAVPGAGAFAADLAGKWTSDGKYVFSFQHAGGHWTGAVTEASSGREFKLADITV